MPLFDTEFLDLSNLEYVSSYLCRITGTKKKMLISSATMPTEHIEELKTKLILKSELPLDDFEVEKELDDKVYIFKDYSNLNFYHNICELFSIPQNNSNSIIDNQIIQTENKFPSPDKLDFIIHHFNDSLDTNSQPILIFSKQNRVALNKKKAFYNLQDSDFVKFETDSLYALNPDITAIMINDIMYVSNFKNFINLFNFKDYLKTLVTDVIGKIQDTEIISNYSDYEEEITHYKYFNSLTKVPNDIASIKKQVTANKEKILKIQEDFECNYTFDEVNENFAITNVDGLKLVIRILSDHAGFDFNNSLITFSNRNLVPKKAVASV